ncbi:MAG: ATP-binding protein, partial [Desulfitobacterium hafniense]|nr:ATP-binding protein [Desulfitobacterium hafniense]
IQDKVAEIQGLISALIHQMNGRSLEPREVAVLEDCLLQEYLSRGITSDPESLYENGIKKQMPTITSLHERLKPRSESLADILTPMLRNGSLGMFDGQTTLKLSDAPMVCFSMKALNVEFTKFFATYVVLGWLWQKFAQRGGKKYKKCVLVDEAWMFMRYSESANILETIARRGRKHGCGLLILTQRFEEFSQSHAGRSVIESCATVMVLKQEEHAAGAAVEYFKLSGGCKDLLVQASPGEGILRLSGAVTGIEVIPAAFEWKYVETKMIG